MKMQSAGGDRHGQACMFQGGSCARFQTSGLRLVLTEPNEVRDLQSGVQERAGGGQEQEKPDPQFVLLESRGDDHGFADEAAEEREGRDGQPADQSENKRPGHFFPQPAELGELAFAGHVQHRAAAHEEQAFVEDMGERMGAGAVDGHRRAQARPPRPCNRPG